MNRLRVRHVTGFHYKGEVGASYNEARMLPATVEGQLVLHSALDIEPASSKHEYLDYWGTRVVSFEALTPHPELSLSASSLVEVRRRGHESSDINWDELVHESAKLLETVEQMPQTARTAPPDEVVELAAAIAGNAKSPDAAAHQICVAVGEAIEYMSGVTGVNSTATQAWEHRKGVCQDIVHVALGALRSIGIPARYVSGYLHPNPDPQLGEAQTGESHAWLEWFAGGWRGFDPTNLIDIGDRHVLVGRGRDYGDVPPLRGVFSGARGSEMFVKVEITREG